MFASFTSSTAQFVQNRRRGLTWVAGTIGGAYLVGQWGMKKMSDFAERQRREGIDKDNLSKRFNLNLQDSQFTVLALLPTVARQVMDEYDVDACWKELKHVADRAKEEAERERQRLANEERAEAERLRKETEAQQEESTVVDVDPVVQGAAVVGEVLVMGGDAPSADSQREPTPAIAEVKENGKEESESTVDKLVDGATEVANKVEAKVNGVVEAGEEEIAAPAKETVEVTPAAIGEPKPVENGLAESTAGLSKSWAAVKIGEDGQAAELETKEGEASKANGTDEITDVVPAPEPSVPTRTRAELWTDIKLLSFTRTITSIYVLTLMTLQTHVQLSLLGRSAYVASVVSTLSGPSALDKAEDDIDLDFNTDRDLEMALYQEKAQTGDQVGVSKDTERKYLTFSWWLLHEGWKLIGNRVRVAVEEIVGPMALKSPIVYGELSTLINQIRYRVEHDEDGTAYDFCPALFPTSIEDEVKTLSSGGIPSVSATINPELRRLLSETHDCLDSSDGQLVRRRLLDALFTHLVLGLEAPFQTPVAASGHGSRFEDVTERTTILAKLLPVVAQHSHHVLNGMSNEYVEAMEEVRELREFSAIIYSSFDRENVRATC